MLQKKILIGALVGLGGLAISSVAFADTNAASPIAGVYVGAQGGYGQVDYGKGLDEDGFAGRVFAGYQFNPYLGVETGFAYLPEYEVSGSAGPYSAKLELQSWSWDILGKATLPFSELGHCNLPMSAYLKAGAAYVHTDGKSSGVDLNGPYSDERTTSDWIPVAGAGLAYNINPNLALDISYTHYFGNNLDHRSRFADDDDFSPDVDMGLVGLTYTFG